MATKWFGINSLKRLLQKIDDRYITKTDAQTKLNTKVDKVSGKALSDQNYTKFEKDKLDTIESHAQVNVLEQVKVNGKEQTITDKAVDLFVPTDDSQIANSADYQNGKQVAASIKVETDARTSADNILQSNIDSETASRLNADENLQSNIEAETSNRIAGDDALTKNLDDEVTRAKDAESTLTTNLNSEVARAKDAESTLTTGLNTLTKNLGNEVSRAKDAESTLTTGLNTLTKNLDDHVSSKSNPHSVTKSQVGLGNVANFDQSKAIKSITRSGTTFTATSLDGTTTTFTQQDNDTTYSAATSSSTGLMSASDKAKLDGIASGANKYTHPGYTAHSSGLYKVTVDSTGHVSSVASVAKSDITALGIPGQDTNTTYSDMQGATTSADGTHGLVPTPAKGSANRYLRSDGAWAVPPNTDTKYTNMTGASASAAGSSGLVPAPSAGTANRYLRSDGTWSVPPDTNTTYSAATSSSTGLMSASDKAKLDGIASGANKYTHPGYTAHSSGLYKVTVDSTGHVSSVASVAKSDITALGIPGQDTNTTYSDMKGATTSADGTHGLVPTPAKGSANRYLRSDGAWAVPPNTDTKYTNMTGASTSAAGSSGLVPAPSAGTANRYLRSDGTWSVPPDTDTKYSAATSSAAGLMSASDKVSLDNAMPRSGGSFTGDVSSNHEISDRYGKMIVSREVNCKNVSALIENVRYTNGCCGSVEFTDAEFIAGVTINATWFNYIWVPHRTGAYNGKAIGKSDNCDYGTLILTSMVDSSPSAIFRFSCGEIRQVRLLDSQRKSFTLSASGWSSGSYTISDSLITASSNQEILPAVGITSAQYNALSKAQIVDGGQAAGSMTLKALGTVPTIDIPIRVIFRGTI